jgi:hypothetical protein
MRRRQFLVLYREFLFRIVDRELLSSHSTGDMSQLLLQLATLLVLFSIMFSLPAFAMDFEGPAVARLLFTLSIEHFLIATTMLAAGLFAVFSWGSMFPGHQDVHVLGPLPVRPATILAAKLAGIMTALGLMVLALHVVGGLVWPLVVYLNDRARGTFAAPSGFPMPDLVMLVTEPPRSWLRLFLAYWATMGAAAMFVFGSAMGVQGVAAALLPHRYFLRVSSFLQLAAFGLIIGTYLLQPMFVRPLMFLSTPASPSFWFLGLLQSLSGSNALAPLARNAYLGLAAGLAIAALAYALSYVRTLRRIAEQPDIAPAVRRFRWLPAFANGPRTAVVHFSMRTLARSTQHRVILAFYWGIGFALGTIAVKLPRPRRVPVESVPDGWPDASLAMIVSSLLLVGVAIAGARVAFGLPRDFDANWVFRMLPVRSAPEYTRTRRRAFLAISLVPVWVGAAIVFLATWPVTPAVGHLVVLALTGAILIEVAVAGTPTIPFTRSYLPGKSRAHIRTWITLTLVLPLTFWAARFERAALRDAALYAAMTAGLALVWIAARFRTAWSERTDDNPVEFEDKPADQPLTLEEWDSRF